MRMSGDRASRYAEDFADRIIDDFERKFGQFSDEQYEGVSDQLEEELQWFLAVLELPRPT